MPIDDIQDLAQCKSDRGSRMARNWLLLALIVFGAFAIGLLVTALL
ncbi:MAG: hypothetical protein ACJAYX_001639 [Planctomycetota bacterium]|jgi:hypothetical protein